MDSVPHHGYAYSLNYGHTPKQTLEQTNTACDVVQCSIGQSLVRTMTLTLKSEGHNIARLCSSLLGLGAGKTHKQCLVNSSVISGLRFGGWGACEFYFPRKTSS